ncbi:MAG: Plug domain-containing protein [Gemmatimonadota bacterium]
MTLSRARRALLFGLGAIAGAVLPAVAGAQVPVPPDTTKRTPPPAGADTIKVKLPARADSMAKNDSISKGVVPLPEPVVPDTARPPLAHAEMPPILEIGGQRIYDRAALFATGALTVSDLLARVPGLTEYTAGFLAAPAVVASAGDFRRIRLYLDGVELDPMNRRARGVAAVNELPIHALEEVRVERGADEVRVYARTWRVDRLIPYTRADISTGDQGTNLYRAFFGRRYEHGEAFQVAAEQATTQPNNNLPSSDILNLTGRLGLTHGPWSVDGFVERSHANRAQWVGTQTDARDTVPSIQTERQTAYARIGNGDPDSSRWFQAIASANSYKLAARSTTASPFTPTAGTDTSSAASDTNSYVSQYLMTGGLKRGAIKMSAAERLRVGGHRTSHVMSGRASAEYSRLSASLFAEGQSYLNPSRTEGTVTLSPLRRVALLASVSRTGQGDFDRLFVEPRSGVVFDETGAFVSNGPTTILSRDTAEVTRYRLAARTNQRAEVGVLVRDLWVTAGMIKRGPTTLLAPAEFSDAYAPASSVTPEGEVTARTLALRGRLWRGIHADAWAVAWSDSLGLYRPKYQTRSELYLQTSLLDKFPHGNFGILTSLVHEYRSDSRFSIGGDSVRVAPGYRAIAFKLEIRIQTAVVSYQFRNLLQENYAQVPGLNLPRQTQFYGVRWDFWN